MSDEIGMSFLAPIAESQRIDQAQAMAPLQQALTVAQARHLSALSNVEEYNLEAEKRTGALMAAATQGMQQPGAAPQPMSAILRQIADASAAGGRPSQAIKMYDAAATMQGHEIVAGTAQARLDQQKQNGLLRTLDRGAQLLEGVTDQDSWDEFNRTVSSMLGGKPSPWASYPYDPDLVNSLKTLGTTQTQKIRAAQQEAALAERKRVDDERIALMKARVAAIQQKKETDAVKATSDKKAAGKDVGSPAAGDVKQATRLLMAEPDLVAPENVDQASYDVAAQAKALRQQNPGMTADDALRKAIQVKKEKGDFVPAAPGTKILGMEFGKGKPGYKPTGGTAPPGAIPLPPKGTLLTVGQAYTQGGVTKTWTANGWDK